MSKYLIWYLDKGKYKVRNALTETQVENTCTELVLEGKKISAVIESGIIGFLHCSYCGGVDAHRYNCKGGYGL